MKHNPFRFPRCAGSIENICQVIIRSPLRTFFYRIIMPQLDSLIPASKISNLSQGSFVGAVSDNFGEKIDQKIFHAEIIVDHARVSAEEKAYKRIPVINSLKDKEGNDIMLEQIQRNYDQIKADAQAIINDEMERIMNDPELCERLGIEKTESENKEDSK